MNDLMGLYTPMHTCITHCQFWKLIWKVQISHDPAINRAPYAQNWWPLRASFDLKLPNPPIPKDNLDNFHWKLSLNLTVLRFKSPRILNLLIIQFYSSKCPEQDQAQARSSSAQHWRYFPEIFFSSILTQFSSILLDLWLSEVLPM